jgi:hypothetical protein
VTFLAVKFIDGHGNSSRTNIQFGRDSTKKSSPVNPLWKEQFSFLKWMAFFCDYVKKPNCYLWRADYGLSFFFILIYFDELLAKTGT